MLAGISVPDGVVLELANRLRDGGLDVEGLVKPAREG
jgi:hypothetical protein